MLKNYKPLISLLLLSPLTLLADVASTPVRKADVVIMPSVTRPLTKDLRLNVTAEILLLKVTDPGLSFAAHNPSSAPTQTWGSIEHQTLDWSFGTRLGLNYVTDHDDWDFDANWTYFGNTHHNLAKDPYNEISSFYSTRLNPKLTRLTPIEMYSQIDASWKLRFNEANATIGRNFFISKWLTIRPNIGIRSAWVYQSYNLNYLDNNRSYATDFYQNQKNQFFGMGGLIGLDSNWAFGPYWSVYGNVALGLLYGRINAENYAAQVGNPVLSTYSSNKPYTTIPTLDLELGIRYDKHFDQDRYCLGFNVGWEQHVYQDLNQLPVFVSHISPGTHVTSNSNLSFQGFAFGVHLDF